MMQRSMAMVVTTLLALSSACAGARGQTPAPALGKDGAPQRTLVIAHDESLRDAAAAWQDYRRQQGWTVALIPCKPPASQNLADRDAAVTALREQIRSAHRAAATTEAAAFAVMLLGDDDAIPAWRFAQTDPMLISDGDGERIFISDQPYQFADDADDVPDFPLGRVPARSNDQAMMLLSKIRDHESAPNEGPDRARVTYVAGEARFGPFDLLLETLFVMMVDQFVPDAYGLSMTYAKPTSIYCPPPSQLTQTVLSRMTEGAALFNYLGHGHPTGLDSLHWSGKRFPIMRVRDVEALDLHAMDGRARPMAFMSCCSVGHFDLPNGASSLAEAMLFHPAGPIAVISGSRVTHPYANTVLQKDITAALLRKGAATAGMLDLLADRSLMKQDADDREVDFIAQTIASSQQWQTSLHDLRTMHAKMYNLLGDPATQLALPATSVRDIAVQAGAITGRVTGMAGRGARVTVSIDTPRIEVTAASRARMKPAVGEDDPDLESKARNNYPLANARTLLTLEGAVEADGRFTLALPDGRLPEGAAVLRVRVTGMSGDDGRPREAIGALRVR